MTLHPEVIAMIEAGPQKMPATANGKTIFVLERDWQFARRIALRQQELEREECAKLLRELPAAKAEVKKLREALTLFTQMRTDAPRFVQTFSMACFVAEKALAATRKEEGNG